MIFQRRFCVSIICLDLKALAYPSILNQLYFLTIVIIESEISEKYLVKIWLRGISKIREKIDLSRFWSRMMALWVFPKRISDLKTESLIENWQMGLKVKQGFDK